MELFLLVSMVLSIVTFLLIVVSEPAPASIAEHDTDYATDYAAEDSNADVRPYETLTIPVPEPATMTNTAVPAPQLAVAESI